MEHDGLGRGDGVLGQDGKAFIEGEEAWKGGHVFVGTRSSKGRGGPN